MYKSIDLSEMKTTHTQTHAQGVGERDTHTYKHYIGMAVTRART